VPTKVEYQNTIFDADTKRPLVAFTSWQNGIGCSGSATSMTNRTDALPDSNRSG
jgi:hypothetical protein